MDDMLSATVESAALIAMFGRLGASADYVCREVGRDTAKRIVAEATSRLHRQVGPNATGVTESEVHWELSHDGKGYVVLGYREGVGDYPIDIYLEYGTNRMYARPWFFDSAVLEEGGHMRRLEEAMQAFLDDVGR